MTRTRAVSLACGLYLVAVGVAFALLSWWTDRFSLATLLAYGPRWPLLLPGLLLAPAAWWLEQRKWAAAVAVALVLVAGPYMGLRLSSPSSAVAGAPALRLVSYNIQTRSLDDPLVARAVEDFAADVFVFQECGGRQHPAMIHGYHVASGSKLCLLSRFPILEVDRRDPADAHERGGNAAILRFVIDWHGQRIDLVALHLETVRKGVEALRDEGLAGLAMMERVRTLRWWESREARAWTERAEGPLLVVGDLNMPVESAIYAANWAHLHNAFGECGTGYGHTKHTRWFGVRIDHVLMDARWGCSEARVGEQGFSDHAPLITQLWLRPDAGE